LRKRKGKPDWKGWKRFSRNPQSRGHPKVRISIDGNSDERELPTVRWENLEIKGDQMGIKRNNIKKKSKLEVIQIESIDKIGKKNLIVIQKNQDSEV
jgi:hypothetical protein